MSKGDPLPLDEVGPWAKEKHERLRRYIDISRAVRRKFLKPRGGGATYVDLYCGSGRALIRDTNEQIDGSPLVSFRCANAGGAPFSEIHIADESEEKCRAAERRIIEAGGNAKVECGSADVTAAEIVRKLNPYGLHFVFLDPYNLGDLPFSVIESFSKLKRIDMLIHVSVHDLQRNFDAYSATTDSPLDRFAPGWREAVDLRQTKNAICAAFVEYWISKMTMIGVPPSKHAQLVTGPIKNQRLYWLVFASRHELAKEFWDRIRNVSGQGELL
jgi:three-Cys-motif partner protein